MLWPIVVVLVLIALSALLQRRPVKGTPQYVPKPLMSAAERDAYRRLRQALPDHLIFTQVRIAQFIEPRIRGKGDGYLQIAQLTADFVVCDLNANVTAVIEIDDRSHLSRRQRWRDAKKDRACQSAGILVTRWKATALPATPMMRHQLLTSGTLQ